MKIPTLLISTIAIIAALAGSASAERDPSLGQNAALHYWAAFAQMQDSAMTEAPAKELSAVLDGAAPYDDEKYKGLVEKNRVALETMARGGALSKCDWGLDYSLGEDVPVDYARKALVLGRLNVLYALHLLTIGDKDGAAKTLAAGFRFSRDVAHGGSLFSAVVAKDLLISHIAATSTLNNPSLSTTQRDILQKAIKQLGTDGLDWESASKRDLEALRGNFSQNPGALTALVQIIPAYLGVLSSTANNAKLKNLLDGAPRELAQVIPNVERVLEEKHDLANKIGRVRAQIQMQGAR